MESNGLLIEELVTDYLSNNLDEKGAEELQRRINISSEDKACFQAMQEIWFASGSIGQMHRFDKDSAYKRFRNHTDNHQKTGKKTVLRLFLYGAAAVALLLIVSYASYWRGGEQLKNRFTDVVVEAPLGSKIKMYLPDGTLVWLNAGSKITYSQGFGVDERNIRLTGEAYFEVTKNEKIPFHVKTEELHVNVLGTKFNFSNYPNNEEVIVSLIEGKVTADNIIKGNEHLSLLPDQKILLDKKTGQMRVLKQKAQLTSEWTNGYLFFDEELLPDIIKTLERSYDVKIRLTDKSLETSRFYGIFTQKEHTIEDILDMLASTNKLKYTKQGKEIVLSTP
jgi:ferric-dicitrate binding protein FerR (iron transport regulator)